MSYWMDLPCNNGELRLEQVELYGHSTHLKSIPHESSVASPCPQHDLLRGKCIFQCVQSCMQEEVHGKCREEQRGTRNGASSSHSQPFQMHLHWDKG